uniref:relaxase/mobilization nuclease domain-containing protein n=1 Tax=Roseburia hominis TaxID=301301 RepID=UPI001F3120CE
MAISKILNMKDCGGHFHGKHLKRSLDYVMNPEKTQDGRLVGAINCQADAAFEQMKETKRKFGKVDKRQGYHIILSFKENEVNPDTAFEITQRFVEEYLGKSYEAVYVVHDNTEHVHSHIVFNSVSFVDGKKYRYEKGDWAKYIQPITNRLCEEYGLSIIDVDDGSKEKQHESYKDWSEYREGSFVWADMIKRDLDACILQAVDYQQFLDLLSDKGYTIKQGKYLAVKPQGMTRFRRCKTLGDRYSDEAIRERISNEDISFYREKQEEIKPVLIRCKVKRYRKAKMSGLQKRYYAKLYRIGKLKKRPYSQAWKYKDDIRRMHKLQKEYLFLANHDIHSAEELVSVISSLTDKRKEVSSEKSRIYKARERSRELFDIADEMQELKPAEQSYIQGDEFFEDEHIKWEMLKQKLLSQGYSLDEVEALRKHYKEEYSQACAKERAVFKELNIGKSIWKSLISDNVSNGKDTEYNKETIRDRKEQPVR